MMNKMDDIENALDLRASKGDLRPDYLPKQNYNSNQAMAD